MPRITYRHVVTTLGPDDAAAQPLWPSFAEPDESCPVCGGRGRVVGRRWNQFIYSCVACEQVWECLDRSFAKSSHITPGNRYHRDLNQPAHDETPGGRSPGVSGDSVVEATGRVTGSASLSRNDTDDE
jgi:hypothetical protein